MNGVGAVDVARLRRRPLPGDCTITTMGPSRFRCRLADGHEGWHVFVGTYVPDRKDTRDDGVDAS